MPGFDDILDQPSTELTADEVNYVRRILRKGALTTVPTSDEVETAVAALAPEERREVRALIDSYGPYDLAGEVEIDGGSDAIQYDAVTERWAIRNDLRVLLGFTKEAPSAGGSSLAIGRDTCDTARPKIVIG